MLHYHRAPRPRLVFGRAWRGGSSFGDYTAAMPGTEARSWRFLITPKWLAWHLIMIGSVYGMLALGDWQLHRAESGNALSWAYTFEWPIFAVFAVVFWAKTIRDEFHPPVATGLAGADIDLPAGAIPGAPRPGARSRPGTRRPPRKKPTSPRTTPTSPACTRK